jgi:amino acid transporter
MDKKLILIFIGLTFLATALFVGTPFEFLNVTADTIASFTIMLLFLLLFILLFRQIRRLDNKALKWTTLGLLSILAIPYLFVGLWTTLLIASNYHPMWQDVTVYTNKKGEKVISQWRETSGSIYDYRDRKIISDYEQFRISFDCNAKNLKGIWTKHIIEKNTTTTINFDQQIDTTKAVKIESFWATPKQSFDFAAMQDSTGNTLTFVTCAEYVYSPFGQVTNKSEIKTGLLKNFSVTDRVDTMDIGAIEFQILKHNTSRLIFFFDNDPEASKHSFIFKGDINDNDVMLLDGIKIGMSKANFVATFFDTFPDELIAKYNIIAFESCIDDIRHTYTFKDDKLKSINFKTHSYWTVNY